jgi:hypothetical protein
MSMMVVAGQCGVRRAVPGHDTLIIEHGAAGAGDAQLLVCATPLLPPRGPHVCAAAGGTPVL